MRLTIKFDRDGATGYEPAVIGPEGEPWTFTETAPDYVTFNVGDGLIKAHVFPSVADADAFAAIFETAKNSAVDLKRERDRAQDAENLLAIERKTCSALREEIRKIREQLNAPAADVSAPARQPKK